VVHTAASSVVAVQYVARVTRTVVCPRQIVAQLLTIVFSSTTFVYVWKSTVPCTADCDVHNTSLSTALSWYVHSMFTLPWHAMLVNQ